MASGKKIIISVVIGLIVFSILLCFNKIGSGAYVTLLSITVLFSVVFSEIGRLKELDLKSLKLVLRDIEKETDLLKKLSREILSVIMMNQAFQGRWGTQEWDDLRLDINRAHVKKIEEIINDKKLSSDIFMYNDLFEKLQSKPCISENEEVVREVKKLLTKHLENLEE